MAASSGEGSKTYQLTLVTNSDKHRLLKNVVLVACGVVISSIYTVLRNRFDRRRRRLRGGCGYGQGDLLLNQLVFQSRQDIDTILNAQYGTRTDDELLHHTKEGYRSFVERVGVLAERFCEKLKDFTGERGETTALDIGCLTGGVSFELARSFQTVYGCDPCKECIRAADAMRSRGWMRCNIVEENDLYFEETLTLDADIDRSKVSFAQLSFDTSWSNSFKEPFDCVVAVHALQRMNSPETLLTSMVDLVAPHGACIIGCSCDWSEESTPRSHWLGGYVAKDGTPIKSIDTIKTIMSQYFSLLHEENIPFVTRETSRKLTASLMSITVWKRDLPSS